MTAIPIALFDSSPTRLYELASKTGLPPEEFLRRRVERRLASPNDEFQQAANSLLEKNNELYRRLA